MAPAGGAIRLYAVLGHPVAHSLSPPMQNAAFAATGHEAAYTAIDVPPERLAASLHELHARGAEGLNVTLPHKEAVFRLLERATPDADQARAANTLRRTERGWEGHATDGLGLLAWIDELGLDVRGAPVLILGAGGAARSVASALAARGVGTLRIVNRDPARAGRLAAEIERRRPATRVRSYALEATPAETEGDDRWALVIRAISADGVGPEEGRWWRTLPEGTPVLDLNYGVRAGPARTLAERAKLRFHDGLGLLLHQGILSFEFWTGVEAPRAAMRRALEEAAK